MDLAFDTETTGFWDDALAEDDKKQAHVCQLGAVLFDGAEILEEYEAIIYNTGVKIPKAAQDVHGISTMIARAKGREPKPVLKEFDALVRKSDRLIAHNMGFDLKMILPMFRRAGGTGGAVRAKDKICTMQSATDVLELPGKFPGSFKWPSLDEAYRTLVDEDGFEGAHGALADAKATHLVLVALEAGGHPLAYHEKQQPKAGPKWETAKVDLPKLDQILSAAVSSPELLTEWECGFVDEFVEKREKYGDKVFVSEKQWDVIQRIGDKLTA